MSRRLGQQERGREGMVEGGEGANFGEFSKAGEGGEGARMGVEGKDQRVMGVGKVSEWGWWGLSSRSEKCCFALGRRRQGHVFLHVA